jgi:hypothetical protein
MEVGRLRLPIFRVPMLGGDFAGKEALDRMGRELFGDLRIRHVKMVSNLTRRSDMKAEDLEREFLAMSEKEQMKFIRKIMPVFCGNMMREPGKVREMFALFTEECGEPMAHMVSMMGMMGRKGGGCCG